jgi:hypothetical protein
VEAKPALSRPDLNIGVYLKHPVDQIFISAYGAIGTKRFNKGVEKPFTGPEGVQSRAQRSSKSFGRDFVCEPHSGLIPQQIHYAR